MNDKKLIGHFEIQHEMPLNAEKSGYIHMEFVAYIYDDDNPDAIHQSLINRAREITKMISPEYHERFTDPVFKDGPLYDVMSSDARVGLFVVPAGTIMPQEKNWQARDYWHREAYGFPVPLDVALATEWNYQAVYDFSDGDVSKIPPLPDPGPEPEWHKKGLDRIFYYGLHISEKDWEEFATLEHVTREFAMIVRTLAPDCTTTADYKRVLREGKIPDDWLNHAYDDATRG